HRPKHGIFYPSEYVYDVEGKRDGKDPYAVPILVITFTLESSTVRFGDHRLGFDFEIVPGIGLSDVGFIGDEVAPGGVFKTGGADELVHQVYGGFSFLLDHVIVVAFVGFAFDDPVGAVLVLGDEIRVVVVPGGIGDRRAVLGVEAFPPQDVFGKVQAHR